MLIKRLQEFIEYEGINIFAFEKRIGLANNSIRKKFASGRSNMGTETLTAILETYPELSADWLLLGKGCMLRKDNKQTSLIEQYEQSNIDIQASSFSEALQIINKQQDTIKELTKALTTIIENSTRQ